LRGISYPKKKKKKKRFLEDLGQCLLNPKKKKKKKKPKKTPRIFWSQIRKFSLCFEIVDINIRPLQNCPNNGRV